MVKYWLTTLLIITLFCGLIYTTEQYLLRTEANDPQIQLAEDAAMQLANGLPPQAAVSPAKIDINKSLAPFLIIYDASGQPLASSGLLDQQIPWLPTGVLQTAKQTGESRITWQPQPDVRIAAVIVSYDNTTTNSTGFVLAGRSLREAEQRESELLIEIGIGWIILLVVASFPFAISLYQQRKKTVPKKRKTKR